MDEYNDKKQEEHCHLAVSTVPREDGMFSLNLKYSRGKSTQIKQVGRATQKHGARISFCHFYLSGSGSSGSQNMCNESLFKKIIQ